MQSMGWLYTICILYIWWQLYSDGFWQAHCLLPLGPYVAVLLPVCVVHVDYNVRRMHEVPLSVGLAMSTKFFPVWTITGINTLFFSHVASPLDHLCWLISRTGSQYEAVFSVVCGTRDIGHVARRRVSPPGSQIRGTARIDCQHEPHTLGVDLQNFKNHPLR